MTHVVSRCRGIDDLHITVLVLPLHLLANRELLWVVVAELKEAFQATAGVLGTLTIEAMR